MTLENAVYMNMKNDVAFLLDARLSLYEHQSTWNVSAKYSCGFPDPQVLPIIVESKDI